MKIMSYHKWFAIVVMAALGALTNVWAAWPPTKFTNTGSVANTRHNMTQSTASGGIAAYMNSRRNDYGEVCVYCHTPHGANTLQQMPLWNRTIKATTYTTYNSFSLTQGTAPQPGNNSLTCLTCHDGQTAIDSIINMPGSGKGLGSQATTQDNTFLDTWVNSWGGSLHFGLNSNNGVLGDGVASTGCLMCHTPDGTNCCGWSSSNTPDFTLFFIGTDLTNDHPVGINYPAASGVGSGFNLPAGVKGTARYFDTDSNGHMDTDEVRLYGTSGTVRVECASCHDPHGVPSAGAGSVFKPTFLRVANGDATGSALCLTCHDK